MRLAHKRKVKKKFQKQISKWMANALSQPQTVKEKMQSEPIQQVATDVVSPVTVKHQCDIKLTPKQQQVLDILYKQTEGINSKNVGLLAGQEESKAASWAMGGLKKLLDEGLVEKQLLAGNKVIYKVK